MNCVLTAVGEVFGTTYRVRRAKGDDYCRKWVPRMATLLGTANDDDIFGEKERVPWFQRPPKRKGGNHLESLQVVLEEKYDAGTQGFNSPRTSNFLGRMGCTQPYASGSTSWLIAADHAMVGSDSS